MPEPPPSGIVVHLFGPDSITSNILPQAAAPAASAPTSNAPMESAAPGETAQPVGSASTVEPGQPAATSYQGPSLHDVLHQMFVTGDPNITPQEKLAPGRAKDHPQ